MRSFLSAGIGYLLGTIPSADIAARLAGGIELRDQGSGNPGAANAAAVLGPAFGLAVLASDVAKGASAAAIGRRLGATSSAVGEPSLFRSGETLAQIASVAAVVGHCYPVWNGFRGGKGVATSVGQVLATFPAYFPIDAAVAVLTAASPVWKQRAFAATSVSSVVWVASAAVWNKRQWPNAWGPRPTPALVIGAGASSLVIAGRFLSARPPTPPAGDDSPTPPQTPPQTETQAQETRTS